MTVGRPVRVLIALLVAAGLLALAAVALTPTLKHGVEEVVRQYLRDHPEVVVEAIAALRSKQEATKENRIKTALAERRGQLEDDPASPVAGNPQGDVTVVEFFDYRCGYCKRVFPSVVEMLNSDPDVRYVFKEYPILGEDSLFAARAALAVWRLAPARYFAFHSAMMAAKGTLGEKRVMTFAAEVGVEIGALRQAMADPGIDEVLQGNFALAAALGIDGTPSFVIGDTLIPGAVDLETLRSLVSAQRDG